MIILNAPLEVAGLAIFLVRLWPELRPSRWRMDPGLFIRFGVLGLIAGVGFLVYLPQGIASGRYETPDEIPLRIIIALDHLNLVGVMTNLTFGLIAAVVANVNRKWLQLVIWGTNLGLVGFVIGLSTDSAAIKRVSTQVMGLADLVRNLVAVHRAAGRATGTRDRLLGRRVADMGSIRLRTSRRS